MVLVGIVGKPNTGKSTFFSAATLIPVPIENRPFTTIKPNRGIGNLRTLCVCKELHVQDTPVNSACIDGIRLIPVELVDCAGLVPDSWKGRGLGNYFLDEIRKADALVHIVDAAGATDEEGRPCSPGCRDPIDDVLFLEREMGMWLAQIIQKDWKKLSQRVEMFHEKLADLLCERLSGLTISNVHVMEAATHAHLDLDNPTKWSEDNLTTFAFNLQKLSKPMIIAANKIDLPQVQENIAHLKERGNIVYPCCAEAELILRRATEKHLIKYTPGDSEFTIVEPGALLEVQEKALSVIRERILRKWGTTGVQEVINAAFFDLLRMITVYPVENVEDLSDHNGRVLPDVYLVPQGTTVKQFAYRIHSDLGTGFLYAIDARTKLRLGDEYVLKDRDIVKIVSTKGRK
ncbi:redox-regulated ATPase YchF [Candidatus Bathyarchaeota archaeon]|nr:redox-regulated ATPase YchF [Candidatus Bathyarchaeota archaeon]